MSQLFDTLRSILESGRTAVTSVVIACRGSTPRAPGAMMLVGEGIPTEGTVGGGQAEFYAVKEAVAMLSADAVTCTVRTYECLSQEELKKMGREYGGEVDLLFLRWEPDRLPLVLAVCAALGTNSDSSLRIRYADDFWQGDILSEAVTLSAPGIFCMKLAESGYCYVFGGGHVSRALVPLLSGVDFPCVVLDERPEYASPAVFPTAVKTYNGNLPQLAREAHLGSGDCVIIMTRGHQGDYEVLTEALCSQAWYIGMVGSRRKMEATFQRLAADGFTPAEIGRVVTPIGLDIEAETPNEIAVSVTAQLIRCRAIHRRITNERSASL